MKKTALFSCLCLLLCATSLVAAVRPNVLLILVDDLKPSFGAYGQRWVHSPNLDRLAARGMRFDMSYCNQAVCAPSRNNLPVGSRSTSICVYSLGYHFRKAVPQAPPLTAALKRTLIHDYYAALSYVDAQVGRVLDEVERLRLEKNTIIVRWGDHGYHLGDHGAWTKHGTTNRPTVSRS